MTKPLRALFVDDEEELVSAVVERLALRGVSADGATSGTDALRMLKEGEYGVVILDVRMPGIGGLDVVRRINETSPSVAVVLISGHGSSEDVEEGHRLGVFDYLQKPVDIDDLVDIMHRAAGAREPGSRDG
jgi:DNA-binding NtrC family response regulator